MAKQARPPGRPGGPVRGQRGKGASGQRPSSPKPAKKTRADAAVVFDAPGADAAEPRVFRLGVVPGATPGKWVDAWKKRMPHVPIVLVPITVGAQRKALEEVDAALVRLPLDRSDDLHVITLYDELPVVVASVDSHLLAAEELTLADLDGETVMTPSDDALVPFEVPGAVAPRFAPLPTADAIATAATGAGVVIVPMSLARLHHRKDAEHRVLADGPASTVALAWPREGTTVDVETFVGIVRGRTANSSR